MWTRVLMSGALSAVSASVANAVLGVEPRYAQGTRSIPAPLFWFGVGVTTSLLREAFSAYAGPGPQHPPTLGRWP